MNFDRADALRRLADEHFDVLVVGGGITGVGVALDAASRGLRTALVERDDLASGTSSKSSKLVHGGIRYLQQREVGLVYEALAERQILRKTAPHLVRVLPFLLPVFTRDGLLPRRLARLLGTTMWAYDLTGGLRIGKLHKRVSKEEALALHADAARRPRRRVVRVLRRADRRRPPHARRRAHRRRLRRRDRQLHAPRRLREGRRRTRAHGARASPTATRSPCARSSS